MAQRSPYFITDLAMATLSLHATNGTFPLPVFLLGVLRATPAEHPCLLTCLLLGDDSDRTRVGAAGCQRLIA